ncbi:MAG: alpha/beta family hydrolase [bacterium]
MQFDRYQDMTEGRFIATPEKGEVTSLLIRPDNARSLLVLGHGASADLRHRTLQIIAELLAETHIATFRYNYPYMERGGGGRDSQEVTLATIHSAVAAARRATPDLPLVAGGHSFGGRMTSLAQSLSPLDEVRGLIFFSFPLHPAGKPGIERAAHLKKINLPMLFLSGTRDDLAELSLLKPVCESLGDSATLSLLDTANHGYAIQKRSRQSDEDIFTEMARVVSAWITEKGIS